MKNIVLFICLCSNIILAQNKLTHVVYFDTDKHDVPSTEENRLLMFISSLDTIDIDKISIYGFCDDRGSDHYNLELSKKRANSIKIIFSNNEIDDSVISNVDGKGEVLLKIVKEEDIQKIRGLNRKVEIIVFKKPKNYHEDNNNVVSQNKNSTLKTTQDIVNGNIQSGDKIRLNNLYFKTGYSFLTPESKKTLQKIAKILVEENHLYFTIQGHVCCTRNSRDAIDRQTKKRNLSVARAKYIYDYLVKKGINKRRMKYVGMRRKFPLGGQAKDDRRVEILITYVGERTH